MTGWWQQFETFLETDPRDVGCEEAMEIMHAYVDLLADGADAPAQYLGMAAHLKACGPCADDMRGLLAAVQDLDGPLTRRSDGPSGPAATTGPL